MPDAPLRMCLYPLCGDYATRNGRCEDHAAQAGRAKEDWRGKTAERGYDAVWKRFRANFLRKHPLCADCQAHGVPVRATDVHHIEKLRDVPGLRCVESNCMGLCHDCHAVRTGRGE